MSRVLVTGGTGTIGRAVVRRLLADPAYDVRVADRKDAPQWMREGCEIRAVDLSETGKAASVMSGCTHVIHLASPSTTAGAADYSLIEASIALDSSLLRAAIDQRTERFVYVSCAAVLERDGEPAADEADPPGQPPLSTHGFAKLVGERLCRAAHSEHGLPFTICRPSDVYGESELPDGDALGDGALPPRQVDDVAARIVAELL